ncbi:MAG: hypothetical protein ACK6DP_06135 [Gemmatimonas sp.]|jgi:hypothetical protein|uniref:hypothetical protein n=1 Tax=Gemmatimonas sp. TaxID=1962908 RepID=UPI00391F28E3|nr:hypothetical protein [Gemmatimonadota bacterium]
MRSDLAFFRRMTDQPHPLTALTLVLGPPQDLHPAFLDFQVRAERGEALAEHGWAQHEYAALDALTRREGAVTSHTLLETILGGVLRVGVFVADVERQWVRHADGRLYAALAVCSEDVRPRAAALALHDPALVDALNGVATALSALDGRASVWWSSRTTYDTGSDDQVPRTAAVVRALAELVLAEVPPLADDTVHLADELLAAIRIGRALADTPQLPLVRELRALRHLDPMRVEWARVCMDAFALGALDVTQRPAPGPANDARGLAYLYLGKERSDRLKADPYITPRFRGELVAKTCMTAYALERLAPQPSEALYLAMAGG